METSGTGLKRGPNRYQGVLSTTPPGKNNDIKLFTVSVRLQLDPYPSTRLWEYCTLVYSNLRFLAINIYVGLDTCYDRRAPFFFRGS